MKTKRKKKSSICSKDLVITLRQPARREAGSRWFDLFTLFLIVVQGNYPGYIVRIWIELLLHYQHNCTIASGRKSQLISVPLYGSRAVC